MKKILCIGLCLAMIVGLFSACGGNNDNASSGGVLDGEVSKLNGVSNEVYSSSVKSSTSTVNSSDLKSDEYWCMGKKDSCKNKTSSASDLYCRSCDPNNDNIEG